MPIDLTTTLKKALSELQQEQARLNQQITAVRGALEQLTRTRPLAKSNSRSGASTKRRHVTAAQRRQISARMKRYWAKRRSAANGKRKAA